MVILASTKSSIYPMTAYTTKGYAELFRLLLTKGAKIEVKLTVDAGFSPVFSLSQKSFN